MKKFGTFSNPNIQPRADGYYDRFNRDCEKSKPIRISKPESETWFSRLPTTIGKTVAIVGFGLLVGHDFVALIAFPLAGCAIKGNISYNGGEKIFHVPGQEYYGVTNITHLKGERYFCSEAEALTAGWRKSGI